MWHVLVRMRSVSFVAPPLPTRTRAWATRNSVRYVRDNCVRLSRACLGCFHEANLHACAVAVARHGHTHLGFRLLLGRLPEHAGKPACANVQSVTSAGDDTVPTPGRLLEAKRVRGSLIWTRGKRSGALRCPGKRPWNSPASGEELGENLRKLDWRLSPMAGARLLRTVGPTTPLGLPSQREEPPAVPERATGSIPAHICAAWDSSRASYD